LKEKYRAGFIAYLRGYFRKNGWNFLGRVQLHQPLVQIDIIPHLV